MGKCGWNEVQVQESQGRDQSWECWMKEQRCPQNHKFVQCARGIRPFLATTVGPLCPGQGLFQVASYKCFENATSCVLNKIRSGHPFQCIYRSNLVLVGILLSYMAMYMLENQVFPVLIPRLLVLNHEWIPLRVIFCTLYMNLMAETIGLMGPDWKVLTINDNDAHLKKVQFSFIHLQKDIIWLILLLLSL